jgi:hypothetical protein
LVNGVDAQRQAGHQSEVRLEDLPTLHGACQVHRLDTPRRTISIRPQVEHEALRMGRAREKTVDFATEYARRAGVERTIAQAVRSHAARRTPYFGRLKTHLAHLI